MKTNDWTLIALILVLLVGSWKCTGLKHQTQQQAGLIKALNDSMHQRQQDDGSWVAERMVLAGEIGQLKAMVNSKDSTIARLAHQVTKRTPIVAAHTVVTHAQVQAPEIKPVATPVVPDTGERRFVWNDKWASFDISIKNYRANINYTVHNEFDYQVIWNKKGDVATFKAVNKNPNTQSREVIMFHALAPKKKGKFWLGVMAGAAATTVLYIGTGRL